MSKHSDRHREEGIAEHGTVPQNVEQGIDTLRQVGTLAMRAMIHEVFLRPCSTPCLGILQITYGDRHILLEGFDADWLSESHRAGYR